MRKNAPRKWIHAILDLLPILIIPIFAININQKSVEPISIEVQEKVSVDFNQLATYTDWSSNGIRYTIQTDYVELNGTMNNIPQYSQTPITSYKVFKRDGSKYYIKFSNTLNLPMGISGYQAQSQSYIWSQNAQSDWSGNIFLYTNQLYTFASLQVKVEVFNLTQMYGRGNEPTIDEFESIFTNSYYEPITSQKMLVDKLTPTTYDDTDIGSQFLYSLYKPVQDYFNFNNLFNMGQIYDWIQLNLFSGTAPLPIFIIWNIIVYEFFVDLIFLLYAVFMFVIDFATCMIDSFMGKARKGV